MLLSFIDKWLAFFHPSLQLAITLKLQGIKFAQLLVKVCKK